ncbi:MAG TPA: DUF3460 family protein [Burkholderiaceae bacterium]|nr:DUF3460 family protein [Burkholderiaceae bacterium]
MATYESELTAFLRTLRQTHPGLERRQAEGRALWWDRQLDLDELRRWQASRVRQSAYVYYPAETLKPAADS